MAATYQLISSVTVGAGGASSIDFTSIPATYTDLLVKLSARNGYAAENDWVYIKFNNNTSSYSYRLLQATPAGGNASSYNGTTQFSGDINSTNSTANTFGSLEIYIPNYASSNNKSYSVDAVTENNSSSNLLDLDAGLWSNTSAINQITFTPRNSTFSQYSTAYLYGIKNS